MDPKRFDLSDDGAAAFCPSCYGKFRSGVTRCAGCAVDLIPRSEIESRMDRPESDEERGSGSEPPETEARLCAVNSAIEASRLSASLSTVGIRFLRQATDALTGPFGNPASQTVVFVVERGDLDRARSILRDALGEPMHVDRESNEGSFGPGTGGDSGRRPRWCQIEVDSHELRDGDSVVATLNGGIATFDGEQWHFSMHKQFFSPRQVVAEKAGEPATRLTMELEGEGEGVLRGPDGTELEQLRWAAGVQAWETEDDWVIRFHNDTTSWKKTEAEVEIDPAVRRMPLLELFLCLGFYLWLAHWSDARD